MPVKKPADPTVLSLISGQIDRVSDDLQTMGADISAKLEKLTEKVNTQNGRVGKCESHIEDIMAAIKSPSMNRKQIGITLGVGGLSGAVILEVLRKVGEALHAAGLFG